MVVQTFGNFLSARADWLIESATQSSATRSLCPIPRHKQKEAYHVIALYSHQKGR